MQFTLKDIRCFKKQKIEDVANYCGVSLNEMQELEDNLRDIPASIAIKLRKLYDIPIDYIKI